MAFSRLAYAAFLIGMVLGLGCIRTGFFLECASTADCPENAVCRDGQCRIVCNFNTDCQSSEYCFDGVCLPEPLLADAGSVEHTIFDAHYSDNKVQDLGSPDTTLPDTTLPDTALPDTTLADTTLADTTLADTTLADTALADTTLPDSGPGFLQLAVFLSPQKYTGNLGGIDGADSICQQALPAGLDFRNVHALLCAYELDLVNMPGRFGYDETVPVSWGKPDGREFFIFANNWADMLDGAISQTAAFATGYSGEVWTGCAVDGRGDNTSTACSYNPNACACGSATGSATKWTVGSSSGYGVQGDVSQTNGEWIHDPCPGWSDCSCNTQAYLMCVAERWQ